MENKKLTEIRYPFRYTNHYDKSIINCEDDYVLKQSSFFLVENLKSFLLDVLGDKNYSMDSDEDIIEMVIESQNNNNIETQWLF